MTATPIHQVYDLSGMIGVIALILLAYLCLLIRQFIRISKINTMITLRRQFMDLQLVIAKNEDLADLCRRGMRGLIGLSDSEQARFFIVTTYMFNHWADLQRYAAAGLVPEEIWVRVCKWIRDFVQSPGVQECWSYRRHWYTQGTQDMIDRLIKEASEEAMLLYPEPSV